MKSTSPFAYWQLGYESWMLGFESASVIGLRSMKMMAGGSAADAEARLMVSEKVGSAMDLGLRAMTGGLGTSPAAATSQAVSHYRRKVRANRRRLTK
ncbi:hypothetical protein [Sphingomonas sp. SUN039]|uniref:hypothetical protein n=1 Tax=Sphingomonas sp. SUN039 TaxID=2937787 RepID=UPI002164C8C3|nr:hypothetical protein [Sphingomonas sp. SUN039]UVO52587.1 hypothetical protein M0209_00025 [Sphingomonas sp. SUN039]